LTLTEDTSGGIHDTLIAACDRYRFAFLGVESYTTICTDNLLPGFESVGARAAGRVPSPLNLFLNIPWDPDGTRGLRRGPRGVPGGYVRRGRDG